MQTIRTIAEFNGWQVVLDANAVISIHFGNGAWICDHASAYDAITKEVKDPETRLGLLKQWAQYMNGRSI